MRKKEFVSKVLASFPDFANTDTFFYYNSFEHVLNGFCCEITPNGAYVWRFVYPLIDRFRCFHLSYSNRLVGENGYINFDKIPRSRLAEEFSLRIAPHMDEVKHCFSLVEFADRFDRLNLYSHPRLRMIFGFANALMGKKEQALLHLRDAAENLTGIDLSDCQMIADLIEIDFALATEKILNFEAEMINTL